MKNSRFTESQIVSILKESDASYCQIWCMPMKSSGNLV